MIDELSDQYTSTSSVKSCKWSSVQKNLIKVADMQKINFGID